MTFPVDHSQRLAALDPQRSVCVTAPAGSGKTELLTQRILKLLAIVQAPEEIIAITFTRKAAAEMHHRLMSALRNALEEAEPREGHKRLTWQLAQDALRRNQELGWSLLENSRRLRIQTIDSFCASLTKQMPTLSGFGAQPQITDQSEQLYQQAVRQLLEQLESATDIANDLEYLLAHTDNNLARVERLLMAMLARREQWLLHISLGSDPGQAKQHIETTLQQIITDTLSQLSNILAVYSGELVPFLDYAGAHSQHLNLDNGLEKLQGCSALPGNVAADLGQWSAIAELFLTQSNDWRKTVNKRNGFPAETLTGDKTRAKETKNRFLELLSELTELPDLLTTFTELRYLPTPLLNDEQWRILAALTRLLPRLVAELQLVFQQAGTVDHIEIGLSALRALGDSLNPSELALRLDYRLSHILIDEFQDTASTQFHLLEKLLEGWAEHNQQNPQSPNTLFIVGDGMQSIYSFRQANVGLFLQARAGGVNGVTLDDVPLQVNFRSHRVIVDWVNRVFKTAFPPINNPSRGAVRHETAVAFSNENAAPPSRACTDAETRVFGFVGDAAREEEARQVVDLIQKSADCFPDQSIAILVRSRSHLANIIPQMQKKDIHWSAADIDPLVSYGSIQDLLALTKALFNVGDQLSWAALLRCPWIGLDNKDLYYFVRDGEGGSSILARLLRGNFPQSLSSFARQRLTEITKVFSSAYQNRQRLSSRDWVEGIWLALGGAASLASSDEFSMVDDYFALLEQSQQSEAGFSLPMFETAIAQLYARPKLQQGAGNVQVMTIHKAKGLEFDTVILPGLSRAARSDEKSLLMWREYQSSSGARDSIANRGLVISPMSAIGEDEDAIYKYLRFEQDQASRLESTRLLYVATTRAVKRLYMTVTSTEDSKSGQPKPPPSNSLISSAWPALEADVEWFTTEPAAEGQISLDLQETAKPQLPLRLQANWQAPAWSFPNPLEEFYIERDGGEDANNLPEMNVDTLAADIGSLCHFVLEALAKHGVGIWQEMDSEARGQWLLDLQHSFALPVQKQTEISALLTQAIDNTLNDDKGRWLLTSHPLFSEAELSLLSGSLSQIKKRIIDRCFLTEDGDIWIIDYKTSVPCGGASVDDFVEQELSHYGGQLKEYKWMLLQYLERLNNARKQAWNGRVRTALYFPLISQFAEHQG